MSENVTFRLRLEDEMNHPRGDLREGQLKQEEHSVFRLTLEKAVRAF